MISIFSQACKMILSQQDHHVPLLLVDLSFISVAISFMDLSALKVVNSCNCSDFPSILQKRHTSGAIGRDC